MELNLSVNLAAEASSLLERFCADASRLSSDLARLQRFIESAQTAGPSAPAAFEPAEAGAHQRLETDAQKAAMSMVEAFELMHGNQRQSVATSLAYALRVASDASAGFQCPTTMEAILRALDGMDAAAKEAQRNG